VEPDRLLRTALEDVSVESPLDVAGIRVFALNWSGERGSGAVHAAVGPGAGSLEVIREAGEAPSRNLLLLRNRGRFPVLLPEGALFFGEGYTRVARDSHVLEAGERRALSVCCLDKSPCDPAESPMLFGRAIAPHTIRAHLKRLRDCGEVLGLCSVWERLMGSTENASLLLSDPRARGLESLGLPPEGARSLDERLVRRSGVAGMLTAVEGRLVGFDLFGSHALLVDHVGPLVGAALLEKTGRALEGEEIETVELSDAMAFIGAVREALERKGVKRGRPGSALAWEADRSIVRALLRSDGLVHLSVSAEQAA
jgi:hypothetical protein